MNGVLIACAVLTIAAWYIGEVWLVAVDPSRAMLFRWILGLLTFSGAWFFLGLLMDQAWPKAIGISLTAGPIFYACYQLNWWMRTLPFRQARKIQEEEAFYKYRPKEFVDGQPGVPRD